MLSIVNVQGSRLSIKGSCVECYQISKFYLVTYHLKVSAYSIHGDAIHEIRLAILVGGYFHGEQRLLTPCTYPTCWAEEGHSTNQ